MILPVVRLFQVCLSHETRKKISMNWFAIIFLPCVAGCQTTKFVKEQDHALKNHVIKNVIAIQPLACVWQCVDTPLCFSMNIRSLPTGWVTCELNNSSKTADPQNVRFSPGTRYYQLAEVGHCTTEQCIYKDVLQDGWFRFGSKLLKIFSERKTWNDARQFCHSIGGKLASITQENENEFITYLLNDVKIERAGYLMLNSLLTMQIPFSRRMIVTRGTQDCFSYFASVI